MLWIRNITKNFEQGSHEMQAAFNASCEVLTRNVYVAMKNVMLACVRYFMLEPIVL